MKKSDDDNVVLLRKENRRGIVLQQQQYKLLSEFILDTLKSHPQKSIGLTTLLELAHPRLDAQFFGDVSWFLLQVKQDLEIRKFITTRLARNREQYISLKNLHALSYHAIGNQTVYF